MTTLGAGGMTGSNLRTSTFRLSDIHWAMLNRLSLDRRKDKVAIIRELIESEYRTAYIDEVEIYGKN